MLSRPSAPLRRLVADESGLGGTVLVIVIAWALAAVLMLTGTLVAAQTIDERVAEITTLVSEIDEDTTAVALAADTTDIARNILSAAQPLSAQLDDVITAAGSINESASSILANAESINGSVRQINATAGSIGASVRSIHTHAGGILTTVRSIHEGIADINRRADVVIGIVQGIKGDTGNVLAQVVEGDAQAGIRGHAHSIDCSPVVRPLSTGCQR
jgi:methyl-accepting chemotaxis protein